MATDREKLDQQAKLHQMQINTRLVAVETSLKLMHHQDYSDPTKGNAANKVDAVTLIANAQMIEGYILGNLEAETKQILEELNKPKLDIVKEMPGHLKR